MQDFFLWGEQKDVLFVSISDNDLCNEAVT